MLIEGVNVLKDLPSSISFKMAFATKKRLGELERLSGAEKRYVVSDAIMQKIADTVSPYGLAAVCEIKREEFALPKGKALLLDGVSDPGNVGTILRTALACDFFDVYLLDSADVFSPKVIRASLGAALRLRTYIVSENEARELVLTLDSSVLDMNGENIIGAKLPKDVLFVAGNEAHGVRKSLKEAAKFCYSLPMKNNMESLNVAVATAVAMYGTIGE